jgi:hypothetical protein
MSEEQNGVHRKPEPSRALVAVENARTCGGNGSARPLAAFVAQMLACRAKVADFRQHRRAQPPAATAAYATKRETGRRGGFERVL